MDKNNICIDIYGEFVNAAARLQSVAQEIWISERALSQIDSTFRKKIECIKVGAVNLPKHFGQMIVWTIQEKDVDVDEIQNYLRPYIEVKETLDRMDLNLLAIDGFIEICKSLRYMGWSRDDMEKPKIEDKYILPKEIERLKEKYFSRTGGSQSRYSLKKHYRSFT